MTKKFEQYIKETFKLEGDFKFLDNVQGLIDSWEDKIDITAFGKSSEISFRFIIPPSYNGFKSFVENIHSFSNDLDVIVESLKIEKVRFNFAFDITGGDSGTYNATIVLYEIH